MIHAETYGGVLHHLRGATATNSTDSKVIAAKMHEMPSTTCITTVSDCGSDDRYAAQMFLMQVKSPIESKAKYGYDLGLRAASKIEKNESQW